MRATHSAAARTETAGMVIASPLAALPVLDRREGALRVTVYPLVGDLRRYGRPVSGTFGAKQRSRISRKHSESTEEQ